MKRRKGFSPAASRFHVVTAVWGAEYRHLFLDVCLPNLLASRNLEALPSGSRYRIFTSREDAEALAGSAIVREVEARLPVDVAPVLELSAASRSKFTKESICHRLAIADARESGDGLIFLCPDHFVSEGAFASVVRRHAAGMRAVVCPGIRVDRDAFLDALGVRTGTRPVGPREVVAAGVNHLHPSAQVQCADSAASARRPIGVFWKVPGEGLLVRCFRLHPLMVDPVRRDTPLEDTIDGHYVRRSCPIRSQVHVVTDSDELALFEMSRPDASTTAAGSRSGLAWRAAATMARCDSHQQSYWMEPIRLHSREPGNGWIRVETRSARFARRVVALHAARSVFTGRYFKTIAWHDSPVRIMLRTRAKKTAGLLRRRVVLLIHATTRLSKFRKRAARNGRRILRRVQRGTLGRIA